MKLISNFFSQLKRRGVIRAAIAYVAGGWALIEFVSVLSDTFTAPEWLCHDHGGGALGLASADGVIS